MIFQTDLALEKQEALEAPSPRGVLHAVKEENGVRVTTICVRNEKGEQALGKPKGTYVTLELQTPLTDKPLLSALRRTLTGELCKLLPQTGTVLVAGLGNESITPDALGPRAARHLFATRHINGEIARVSGFDNLRPVAALTPGVLGQTGIETAEILESVVRGISPAAVIVIDALSSRRLSRLGTTVQLTDTGLSPGSGVGNKRAEISFRTLGVPVIAVGVPTVVDGATLISDWLDSYGIDPRRAPRLDDERFMMVTPKEVDLLIDRAAAVVAMGINCALQPTLSEQELLELVQ